MDVPTPVPTPGAPRRKVAVIGSGVAGLTAAYLLQRAYDVTLFEADDRLGGHAHTHDLPTPSGPVPVDSAFLVHNERTYPQLTRLFRELGVRTFDTEMSMSVTCRGCGLQYAGGRGLRGLLPHPGAAARPRYLRLLTEVPRFHRLGRALATAPAGSDEPTLGEFLRLHGFDRYFTNHFVVPLVAAVWSCPAGQALHYPARYLMAFLANHGLLRVTGSPVWRSIEGGSRAYVERAVKDLTAVRTSTPVRALTRHRDRVDVRADGELLPFDAAVVAVHPDQALRLLTDPTGDERAVLGAIGYAPNRAVLHTDGSALPGRRSVRASWNYLVDGCATTGGAEVRISYDVKRLQRLDIPGDCVVTLGDRPVRPGAAVAEMTYRHPVYTPASVAAQRRLPELDTARTVYAGAYHGWGFHEDGCASGVRAAAALGVGW
ncbi:FAD-dependent oxidoreductase [Kitasatospora sp. NPDC049285]|uniref:NAD(P)/FAD-dependent oxidoreductase n=1 Tax=Kitasatospora sp. NPDC049285 TaxID=3157096 RepID=UPI00341ECC65